MKNKLFLLNLIICFSIFANSYKIISSGKHDYKALKLTPEIYNNINPNFSGIYIQNLNKKNIPYFTLSSSENIEILKEEYTLTLLNSFFKENNYFLDYGLPPKENTDILSNAITFSFDDKDFFKEVEVFGSYDNVKWEKIKDDSLYKTPNEIKNQIDFDNILKYNFFRIKFKNVLNPIKILDSKLILFQNNFSLKKFEETFEPKFTYKTENSLSTLEIFNLKNLKIKSIEFITDDIFKREFSSLGVTEILYNLNFKSNKKSNTTMHFSGEVFKENSIKIYIKNNADHELNIKKVRVTYYLDYLIFQNKNNDPLFLNCFSNDTNFLIFDIVNYKTEVLKESIDLVKYEKIAIPSTIQKKYIPKKTNNYKSIFNLLIIILGIFLSILILNHLSKNYNKK